LICITLATQERLLAVMPPVMLAEQQAARQPALALASWRTIDSCQCAPPTLVFSAYTRKGQIVFDVLLLVLLGMAFAGTVGYVWVCADLTRPNGTTEDKTP
jgi:hypothetical protein